MVGESLPCMGGNIKMQQLQKTFFLITILISLLFPSGAIRIAESADPNHAPSRSAKAKRPQYDEIIPSQNPRYQKIKRNGKWGCRDSWLPDKELIPPKYDDISCNPNSNLTEAKLNGKWGYINWNGQTIIPFDYDEIGAFKDDDLAAKVKRNGKWGYLNVRTRKEFSALKWDEIGEFFSIKAITDTGERTPRFRRALSKYREVGYVSEGRIAVSADGKWGFVDETGKEIIPPKFAEVQRFSEGLAGVGIRSPDNAGIILYGYIDRMGKEVVKPKYDEAKPFYEGLAPVNKQGKWGFIDKTGKEVTPLQYRAVKFFHEGLAAVSVDDLPFSKWGFIDKNGNVIVRPEKYTQVEDFREGMATVSCYDPQSQPSKTGFIDKTGKEIIPLQFDAAGSFSEGLAAVYRKSLDRWGFVDKAGKVIIPFQYNKVNLPFTKGRARVTVNQGRWPTILIDKRGQLQSEDIIPAGSIARVRLNKKWGYIDSRGNEFFPLEYDEIPASLADHRFNRIKRNGKYGYLDQQANEILPPKYDDAPEDLFDAHSELRIVRVSANGKYGYLSRDTGTEVIPVQYDDAPSFGEYAQEPARMKVKLNGKWGNIDLQGREISSFRYEDDPCAYEKSRGDHYIFGDQVEMKERPDESSSATAVILAGANIEVFGKTDQELAIGDVADKWYEVKYQGKHGYVWGASIADAAARASVKGQDAVAVIRNRTRDTDHSYHRKFEMQLVAGGKIIDQLLDKELSNHTVKVRSLKYESFEGFSAPLHLLVMTFDGYYFEFADHSHSRSYYYLEDGRLSKVIDVALGWEFKGLKGTGAVIMPDKNAGKDAVTLKFELSQPFFGEKSGEKHYIWSWGKKTFLPTQ